ncbi:MAG: alpha-galactosidase [Lachnospiraceae bacterium]|nr:alpha-galactosidase [Lachnospiraceae bacterium]
MIIYNENEKVFNLHTKNTTYQMYVEQYGYLLHGYYGRRVADVKMEQLQNYYDRGFSGNPNQAGKDRLFSLDTAAQEYTSCGIGDYRVSSCGVINRDGSTAADLRYVGYKIYEGKYAIPGLPAAYDNNDECETLEVTLEDPYTGLRVVLYYAVFEAQDIITRNVRFENAGVDTLTLNRAMSVCLDMQPGDWDVMHFHGRHCMERQPERLRQPHGITRISSKRGTSSHQHNPFVILASPEATETNGDCYGAMLVYSGDFAAEIEMDQFNQTRLVMGINSETFSWQLESGASFETPEVLLGFTHEGFSALSGMYHRFIRNNICRGKYKNTRRPVLVNNWEGTYFDFNQEKLIAIAEEASSLGIELFVLDDGWFGKRDDDYSGLGDWYVNEKKVQLEKLAERVNELGMKFGLWIEPEMVNEDSNLYKAHPDWALKIPGRAPGRSRYQLLLDFSRKEVVDYVYNQISSVLSSCNIEYVKWDFNRSLADTYSLALPKARQGEVRHRFVLGMYDFAERLTRDFPNILLEGCSGGGGRFDAGMLYYSPQIWCSDDTDAMERILIQYGTSFGYPASSVGSHVSAVPNHQTGRISSMELRGAVAMSGMLGYELDLTKLKRAEKAQVRKQIQTYKKTADLVMNGEYYRLSDPIKNPDYCAWSFVSEDKKKCLVNFVYLHVRANAPLINVRFRGLKPDAYYKVRGTEQVLNGAALMYGGYTFPITMEGDGYPIQIYLEEK